MNNHTLTCKFARILTFFFFSMIFLSCQKEDTDEYEYPSVIDLRLNESLVFDATENQIISLETDSGKIDFKLVSLINYLCPEGAQCYWGGYAIIGLKSIVDNDLSDTIKLFYPLPPPTNISLSDSAFYIFKDQIYLIKLVKVRKVFYDDLQTQTKSILDLEIKQSN